MTPQYKAKGGEILDAEDGRQCAKEEVIHLIIQKNYWEEKATELADVVWDVLGFDVGEHSSSNCHVQTAINALRDMERIIDKWKTAEQRAEKAEKDLAATRIEAAEILHNKQAKIEVLKTAECDAVRKLRGLLEDALPHISCTTKEQSDLVTEIGKALYEEKDQ